MIYLLATRRGSNTFMAYLDDWAGDLKSVFEVLLYEDFMRWPATGQGTYIFSDIERLTDEQLAVFRDYADQLQCEFPDALVLNHPLHALRRMGLLEALHAGGINTFRAYPVNALLKDIRFPVFLRKEREHAGPASPLIRDFNAFWFEALRLAVNGIRMEDMMVVEYCETRSPDGWYRKYSAFRFGNCIIPAHIIFSNHWVAKDSVTENALLLEEEVAYIRNNPHQQWLMRVFESACIQYGRIDYSMLEGQPQIWEINTNPILLKSRAEYERTAPLELPNKESLASMIANCLTALDVMTPPSHRVPAERHVKIRRLANMISPDAIITEGNNGA